MSEPLKNTLSDIHVSKAMRRQVVRLNKETTIASCINTLIKYKINALLTTDRAGNPAGVVSKTDIMGAFYAGLPIDSPIEYIMSSPPLFCKSDDFLETALEIMRSKGIYRLYVMDGDNKNVVGSLAYPDIVGLLYQYCHVCGYNHFRQKNQGSDSDSIKRTLVKEIMTATVKAVFNDDSLSHVMEELSAYKFGAILVQDRNQKPAGVISKTDLALAYKHGIDPQTKAEEIMSSPVKSCSTDELMENAIKKMIFSDLHRLFVHHPGEDDITGVFSLSDAARNRSGSCQACISSRIKLM